MKIPQRADVVIEDDVEIGANTTIDRPAVGETRIGAGTKIDNLVQIAPRRQRSAAACCSRRRSASPAARVIDDDVILAGQVGVAGHLHASARACRDRADRHPELASMPASHVSGYPGDPATATGSSRPPSSASLPALRSGSRNSSARLAELEEKLHGMANASNR